MPASKVSTRSAVSGGVVTLFAGALITGWEPNPSFTMRRLHVGETQQLGESNHLLW